MLQKIRRSIARQLLNYRGWRTNRKIIIIESDDWGSIRMPSKRIYNKFVNKGIPLDKSPYCRLDTLATNEDLEALFEILTEFKDCKGNHPVFTANTIVANPDFKKIRESDFQKYYYKPFTETLNSFPKRDNCFEIWKQGIASSVFNPQFHGREHLNVSAWLNYLQDKSSIYRIAFDNKFWGFNFNYSSVVNIQSAFDAKSSEELENHFSIVDKGLFLFRDIFGYNSKSFIAPNYVWDSKLNEKLDMKGVKYLQGMKMQKLPIYKKNSRKMIRRYMGEENQLGQIHLIRNCVFEPSLYSVSHGNVENCLKGINNAFLWGKPAIITSHRINYIGTLDETNRTRNLKQLKKLLESILIHWPDVEFLTSQSLGDQISSDLRIK